MQTLFEIGVLVILLVVHYLTLHHNTFLEAISDVIRHMCGVQNSLRRMNTVAIIVNATN